MKFKKLITGSVVAASLFGVSLGSSSLNAKASDSSRDSSINAPNQLTPQRGALDSQGYYKGQNSGKTNANIYVDNGLLNLDNVPNLSFGNNDINQYSTQLGLQNNENNTSNILQVTDNRNPNKDTGAWTVSASLGQVNKTNDEGQPVASNDTDWAISLNSTDVQNDENHPFKTTPQTFGTNGNSQSGYKPIMSTQGNSSQGQGVNTIHYNNDSSDASLTIPYNVKRGHYSADVNWNLSVTASAGTANGGTANGGTANGGTANGGTANGGTANGGTANGGQNGKG